MPAEGDSQALLGAEMQQQAQDMLHRLQQHDPQASIAGPDNIWIMKPGGASRGRGIFCCNNLRQIEVREVPSSHGCTAGYTSCLWHNT